MGKEIAEKKTRKEGRVRDVMRERKREKIERINKQRVTKRERLKEKEKICCR